MEFGVKKMTDIKSQILTEVEQIGGNVIAVADAMEKCPTLAMLTRNDPLRVEFAEYIKVNAPISATHYKVCDDKNSTVMYAKSSGSNIYIYYLDRKDDRLGINGMWFTADEDKIPDLSGFKLIATLNA